MPEPRPCLPLRIPARGRRAAPCVAAALLVVLTLAGCQKMAGEGRYKPLEASESFADGMSARQIVSGTLPLDAYLPGEPVASGRAGGELLTEVPISVDGEVLAHGQERFVIYCIPCHGAGGHGDGTVVQHGFPPPPPLLSEGLRQVPVGHLYVVISEGVGAMPNYDIQIPPLDRWAIVAALRSMQDAALENRVPGQDTPAPEPAATGAP
jgi:mono/diheme cytochrome c family protein